jgi:hypothetical protein
MAGELGVSVRRHYVGGWLQGNKRNCIIQRGMMKEVRFMKKFEIEDSKEKQKI